MVIFLDQNVGFGLVVDLHSIGDASLPLRKRNRPKSEEFLVRFDCL